MDLLKIEPDTPLEVTTDGKGLRVVPANNSLSEAEKEELHGILEEAYDQYGNALKNLAK